MMRCGEKLKIIPEKKMKKVKKYYQKLKKENCTCHYFAICIPSHLCHR